ncbi:MAG TPA: type IX secretion system membrane protein PorP/SprF [Ohtaekwangia sp.]
MKKNILFGLMMITWGISFCQQDPLYSQYIINPFIINPAYAGYSKDLNALAAYRLQWAGYDGSPVTMNASGHIALTDNRMGLGLTVLTDKIGSEETTTIQASYAYHLLFKKNVRISFGLNGGVVNYKNDFSNLVIDENDPKFQSNINVFKPTVGAGVIFSSDHFFIGLSVPKMLESSASVDGTNLILYNQHAYAHLAYLFTVSPRLKLKPFVMGRAVQGSTLNTDFGICLNADDSYTIGLFTRNLNTYGFLAKLNLGDMVRMGYVFELPTNKSVGSQYTSHEVTLGIRMRVFRFHDIEAVADF